jgi:hypothetical protein
MMILKLLVGPEKATLIESGEGHEEIRQFCAVEELTQYLNNLGLLARQLSDLRAGRVVGITSEQGLALPGARRDLTAPPRP